MVENIKRSNFEVLGMCCATEATLVERILKPLHGVKAVSVIVPARTVTVVHDVLLISESQIGYFYVFLPIQHEFVYLRDQFEYLKYLGE